LGYALDGFLYRPEHFLDFRAAVAGPFDGLLYGSAFDTGLLGCIANFMFLLARN
jgi:hypothetical protein